MAVSGKPTRPRKTTAPKSRPKARSSGKASWLAWTTITREDLAQAQRLLVGDGQGVRDPLGLNAIHHLYADRFFPGTSVQMTHLRYVFFVAAAYEKLRGQSGDLESHLSEIERRTALQLRASLKNQNLTGIIGHTIADTKAPEIRPSMSYWTALTQWGLLAKGGTGEMLRRATLQHRWPDFSRPKGRVSEEFPRQSPVFEPVLEGRWNEPGHLALVKAIGDVTKPLSFVLTDWERQYLKGRLSETQTFFGALAQAGDDPGIHKATHPWSREVRSYLPDDDRAAMRNAERLAYLVEVIQALYDACVAQVYSQFDQQNNSDGRAIVERTEQELERVFAPDARSRALAQEAILPGEDGFGLEKLSAGLVEFLRVVRAKLRAGDNWRSFETALYDQELRQKLTAVRMRLHRRSGKDQRTEWLKIVKEHTPRPLNYRWPIVKSLLADLAR